MNYAMRQPTENIPQQFPPEHYRIRWLIGALAVLLCITFFPYLFGGQTFLPIDLFDTMTAPANVMYGPPQAQNHYIFDGLAQTYPYKVLTKEALEKGRLTYWNPHILAGYPQYAESLANNFDVFNVLLLWFSPLDFIHLQTVLELFVAGIGMILLLRFLRVGPLINLLFATAYSLNSFFIASIHYRCTIASFCWVPFVILMILRYFHFRRKEDILYASVFLALAFLGGNFQTSFFAAFIVAVVILCYPTGNSSYTVFPRIGILAFIGVVAFALSAIMWFPSLELLFQSLIGGGSLNSTYVYSQYTITQRLLSFPLLIFSFFSEILGNAETFNLRKIAGLDILNFNGAITFLPALFALWGVFAFWKQKNIRPFIIIGVLGIVLPIATPLFSILYHRFFIVSSFSFCVVGAVAFHFFIESERVRSLFARFFLWTKIVFSALVLILIAAWVYIATNYQTLFSKFTQYVTPTIPGSAFGTGNESWMLGRVEKTLHYYSSFSPSLWLPMIAAAVTIVAITLYGKRKLSKRNVLLIVLLCTFIPLFTFTRSWLPSLDTKEFPVYPKNPIYTYLQNDSSGGRYTTWRDGSIDTYILPENGSNIYKTNDLHGYETCTNRSMIVFYKRFVHTDSLNLRLLGLANVKYIITGKRKVNLSNLRNVFSADSMTIYENALCKPRAYFAYSSKVVGTDSAAAVELLRADFDGSEAIFTSEDSPTDLGNFTKATNSIRFDKSENEELIIKAHTDSRGIFVLTDTYYLGWNCYVNGVRKPIFRVNNCMRSVILDAGESTIIFRFEPSIFTTGAAISAIAVFLCFIAVPILKRRSNLKAYRLPERFEIASRSLH